MIQDVVGEQRKDRQLADGLALSEESSGEGRPKRKLKIPSARLKASCPTRELPRT